MAGKVQVELISVCILEEEKVCVLLRQQGQRGLTGHSGREIVLDLEWLLADVLLILLLEVVVVLRVSVPISLELELRLARLRNRIKTR